MHLERAVEDPARAEWIDAHRWPARPLAGIDGRWQVAAQFRAPNGFGALRRASATFVLQWLPNGDYRVIDLSTG